MMVAYDEVYAFFFSISNFIDCLNAAVEHDYKFYVVFCEAYSMLLSDIPYPSSYLVGM